MISWLSLVRSGCVAALLATAAGPSAALALDPTLDPGIDAATGAPQASIAVGRLRLTACIPVYGGYCGSLALPLDRKAAETGTIDVGFEFYPHTGPGRSAGVILAQEGGPGYSTTGSRDGYLRLLAPLRGDDDVLLVDKRGTGSSSPIDCPTLQKATPVSPDDIAACGRQLGTAAWFYRSAEAADDVADVVSALGFDKAAYYGDSYGAWFGQVLAALHPNLLTALVLDSAYPIVGDPVRSEITYGPQVLDLVCRRSPSCARLGASASERFAALLARLRADPVAGPAPDGDGDTRDVTADPAALFLVVATGGNAPTVWRDLDAAGRALMRDGDARPLLRLVAEARGGYASGPNFRGFSAGLADAVQCADYPAPFRPDATPEVRLDQLRTYFADLARTQPAAFSPFAVADAIDNRFDVEGFKTCLTWPTPPSGRLSDRPLPAGTPLPPIPTLVLSGELDTVTSPQEGRVTAALLPNSTYIEVPNALHEAAIADEGQFVSPRGEDLAQCVGPIVRRFLVHSGDTGDTACLHRIRPIRTVPAFARSWSDVAPVEPVSGDEAEGQALALASAASETVGDAVSEFYVNQSGHGVGLRGGSFSIAATETGYRIDLQGLRWTEDLALDGTIDWNQLTGDITADVDLAAPGHSGRLRVAWNDRQTEAVATLSGRIDGAALAATRLAP